MIDLRFTLSMGDFYNYNRASLCACCWLFGLSGLRNHFWRLYLVDPFPIFLGSMPASRSGPLLV
jgi:hypothetical protein